MQPILYFQKNNNCPGLFLYNKNLGKKYFILAKGLNPYITIEGLDSVIVTPIEDLFKKLI